jgi:hypothetical protein
MILESQYERSLHHGPSMNSGKKPLLQVRIFPLRFALRFEVPAGTSLAFFEHDVLLFDVSYTLYL